MAVIGRNAELLEHKGQLVIAWLVFFLTAGITYQAPPVLLPSLMEAFDATRYEVSWLPATFQLFKGISTLPGGYLVHHLGPSVCMRWGAVAIVLATAIYPFAWNLWVLAVLHAVLGSSYSLCGIAPVINFATTWFQEARATSIGILITAFSMAGVGFPTVLASVITWGGWRVAAGICSASMVLTALPLTFLLHDGPLREAQRTRKAATAASEDVYSELPEPREERAGLTPRGAPSARPVLQLTFRQSLRNAAVWHLAFLSLYQLYVVIALMNTLTLFLKTDAHLSLTVCGLYSSCVFVTSIFGKLLIGVFMDSPRFKHVAGAGSCFLLAIGTCMPLEVSATWEVSLTSSHKQLLCFAIIYGFGFGASYTVVSSKPAKMFGTMPEFSKLQGFLMLFQVLGGFAGTVLTGKLRAVTGSYLTSFLLFVIMSVLGCFHSVMLEWGEARREASEITTGGAAIAAEGQREGPAA